MLFTVAAGGGNGELCGGFLGFCLGVTDYEERCSDLAGIPSDVVDLGGPRIAGDLDQARRSAGRNPEIDRRFPPRASLLFVGAIDLARPQPRVICPSQLLG